MEGRVLLASRSLMRSMPGKPKLHFTNSDRRVLKPWVEWSLLHPVQSTQKMFVSVLTGSRFTTDFELRQEVEALLATGKWKIAYSTKGAKEWAMNGGIPGNIRALSDSEVVAEIPQFELLAEVMPYRNIFPVITVAPEMMTAVNEGIVAAVTGAKGPKQALDDLAAIFEGLLIEGEYIQ